MKGKPEAKTDLTKQELMRIFEEQVELKNAEIGRLAAENKKLQDDLKETQNSASELAASLVDTIEEKINLEGRLEAIRQHAEKRCKPPLITKNLSDLTIYDQCCSQYCDLEDWFERLGVLLNPEASDVAASRKEIREGKTRKFTDADDFLKELKEGDPK